MNELEKLLEELNIPKERRKFYSLENGALIVPTIEMLFKNGVIKENDFQYLEWLKYREGATEPTENDKLKAEIDFNKMVRQSQQAEIDYLKMRLEA